MSKQDDEPIIGNTTLNTETVLIVNASSSGGLTGKNWNDFYLKGKEFLQKILKLPLPPRLEMVQV